MIFSKLLVSAALIGTSIQYAAATVASPTDLLAVGSACSPNGVKCDSGLVCEDSLCKITEAEACHDTPNLCVSGKHCVGRYENDKKCKDPMLPGQGCKIDPYWVCADNLLCENQTCKIREGDSCEQNPDQCFSELSCVDVAGSKKCMRVNPAGEECKPESFTVCEEGLECENEVCKIPEAGACHDTPDFCVTGKHCVGRFENDKKCKDPMLPGQSCKIDPYWVCADNLLCEGQTCKIRQGDSCEQYPDQCFSELSCVELGGSQTCVRKNPVGEECKAATSTVCEDGLVCENETCKIPERGVCTEDRDGCLSGLYCVGANEEKRCKKLMPPGGKCRTDPFWICERGLACQRNICRIRNNRECTDYPDSCVRKTECVGTDDLKKCKRPKRLGARCTGVFSVCSAKLVCDNGRCKLPEGSLCKNREKRCVSGTKCVGNSHNKKCKSQ